MDGNAREPGGNGRFAGKLVQVFVGADVGILDHVLGLAVVPKDCTRHAVKPLVVAPHDGLKKSGLPLQNTAYSLLVTQFQKSRLKHWAGSHETPPPWHRVRQAEKVTLPLAYFRTLSPVLPGFVPPASLASCYLPRPYPRPSLLSRMSLP